MTSPSTEAKAPWQIEIDRGEGHPAEYHSIKALKLSGPNMVLVTPNGEQVTFKNRKIRKILIMRTKEQAAAS
jgi:hypothetical protein